MREDPELQPWQDVQLEVEHCTNAYVNSMLQQEFDALLQKLTQWWLHARSTGMVQRVVQGWDLFNVGDVLTMGVEALDDPATFKDDEQALGHVIRMAHNLDSTEDERRVASAAVILHQLANEARRRAWGQGYHNRRTPPQPGDKPPVAFQPDYPDEVTKEQLDAIQKLAYKDGVPNLRKIGEPGW